MLRFVTLTDCEAEPAGIYFVRPSARLFVNVKHRGGDHLDRTMSAEQPADPLVLPASLALSGAIRAYIPRSA